MSRKISIIVLACCMIYCLGGCGQANDITDTETVSEVTSADTTEQTESSEAGTKTEETTEAELPVIYDGDELINTYLNRYNDVNSSNPIDSSAFEVYHHHGSDHKDQILLKNDEFSSIVITSQIGKIKIDIEGKCDNDTYKKAFLQYAKGYSSEFTDDKLGEYWEQSMNNQGGYTQFDEFEVYIRTFNDSIELLEISGNVK